MVNQMAFALLLTCSFIQVRTTDFSTKELKVQQPVVVMELFTSEGCSSCPPADRVLSEWSFSADKSPSSIYPLSFHVDYWDYLGWKDEFASSDYSKRQKEYNRKFGNDGSYTPQVVINGRAEMVGSDRKRIQSTVESELKRASTVNLLLKVTKMENKLSVSYTVDGSTTDQLLQFAIVQKEATSKVLRGENKGATLHHVNVVRTFETEKISGAKGTKDIVIPSSLAHTKASLIVYLQDANSLEIKTAAAWNIQ